MKQSTMLDPDAFMSPSVASTYIPGNPTPETVRNWIVNGFVIPLHEGDTIVRLFAVKPGKMYQTTWRWIVEFMDRKAAAEELCRQQNGRK
jgi:hypothetical protein